MNRELNVYLCDQKIGTLRENELLQFSFQYDSMDGGVQPLSVNLPLRSEEYPHMIAFPFFENLTPEGDVFEILTKDHTSGNKVYSILDRFGSDCAGAVAFYETEPNTNDNTLHEITSSKILQIIERLPKDPLLTSLKNPPRLSLAGAQSKFAVYKFNNRYYRSSDTFPTTHIIKITNKRFPNLLENELFCMKLAQIMQMDIPNTEIKTVKDCSFLEIERYDRQVKDGVVHRIHQEDFCQALGIVSNKKYQAGGGANLKDCFKIIEKFSENKLTDYTRFIEWIIFNYLIGNTDAHAKNISLLHTKNGIKLAPFYDLLSTEVYPQKIVDHGTAMLINGKGKYASLKQNDFTSLFGHLGLNATNMMKTVKSKFTDIVSTAETLRSNLSFEKVPVCNDIIAIIRKRAGILLKQ
ncbi:MAG: type II toxin-antitoxin system HipA family toxin [Treponema sp.]|nr:type II toxin-antitoxin system HipA family toxin [Treponema sp.]